MKLIFIVITVIVAMGTMPLRAAPDTAHEHGHDAASMKLPDAPAERWQTDAPLRKGMEGIREAVESRIPDFHSGRLSPEDVDAIAGAIDTNVEYMVANCELEPRADATLHGLLGEMLAAKQQMSTRPDNPSGFPGIVKALARYPQYFEHPGWKPLETGQ